MDDFVAMAEHIRNWGRWGTEDELGCLNFITDNTVRAAAALVTKGQTFALGIGFGRNGPQGDYQFRRNPLHTMTAIGTGSEGYTRYGPKWTENPLAQELATFMNYDEDIHRFNDDMIVMHLQCATQWDALSHVYYGDKLYNGFPASTVTAVGAARCSIDKVDVKGVTSRGVLLDVVRYRGAEIYCTPDDPIMPDELTAVAKAQNVEVRAGDIVLVRTGWLTEFHTSGTRVSAAGLYWTCAEWLFDRSVAAVAVDNPQVEHPASDILGISVGPMHLLCLRDMGLMFGEFWDLDALAADCADDGRYEFQVIAPPLRVIGAVGSPVNPIAIK